MAARTDRLRRAARGGGLWLSCALAACTFVHACNLNPRPESSGNSDKGGPPHMMGGTGAAGGLPGFGNGGAPINGAGGSGAAGFSPTPDGGALTPTPARDAAAEAVDGAGDGGAVEDGGGEGSSDGVVDD